MLLSVLSVVSLNRRIAIKEAPCLVGPGLPRGGPARSPIDGAEWQPQRDALMWGSFNCSQRQRIEGLRSAARPNSICRSQS